MQENEGPQGLFQWKVPDASQPTATQKDIDSSTWAKTLKK